MADDYDKLLDRAHENLPDSVKSDERFTLPHASGHIQGQKTIINNIYQIAQTLHRSPEHLTKFLLRELATPGDLKDKALILGRKVSAKRVNEKIRKYADIFVLCKECGKPDTQMVRADRITFVRCMACGARHPVTGKI